MIDPEAMHLSVDLETFGNGSNAYIASIGAIAFNMADTRLYEFSALIEGPQPGSELDPDTVRWWLTQDEEARKSVAKLDNVEPFTLPTALLALRNFYGSSSCEVVWAHATFDPVILANAFRRCFPEGELWPYRNVRDLRTIMDLVPDDVYRSIYEDSTWLEHVAFHDAYRQAAVVRACYAHLVRPKAALSALDNFTTKDLLNEVQRRIAYLTSTESTPIITSNPSVE